MKVQLNHRTNNKVLDITIRLFEDGDAQGVIDCIRAEYGDTYFKRDFYNPDYIKKMHSEDAITFIVAKTSEDSIAGIIALKSFFPGETMCELASEIFKKEYRGYHLAEQMIQYGMELIEQRCYSAIYALPVTFHSISQNLLARLGMTATGFIFSVFVSQKVESSYLYGRCLKHSQGIQIKPMEKNDAGTLYLPAEIKEYAQMIYTRLGVDFQINTPKADQHTEQKTMLYFRNDGIHRNCMITILKPGADLKTQIDRILAKYKEISLQTFNVFLNVSDKNAAYAYDLLKSSGFFFTGFKPLCSDHEYIVMHDPNGVELCLDDYVLNDEFEELLRLIKPFQIKK